MKVMEQLDARELLIRLVLTGSTAPPAGLGSSELLYGTVSFPCAHTSARCVFTTNTAVYQARVQSAW